MKIIKVAIVDDHKIFLDGITSLLDSVGHIELVFVAENGEQAFALLRKNPKIDVLISDISMEHGDGKALCEWVKVNYPHISMMMLSMHDDIDMIYELFQAGAMGYLLKNTNRKELITAIESIASGIPFYNDTLKKEMFDKAFARRRKSPQEVLTKREVEVIKLIAAERTTQEIAGELCISQHTVESHRKNILRKTNVRNLAGLIKFALKAKIIE